MEIEDLRLSLEQIYRSALAAVDPETAVLEYLEEARPNLANHGKVVLVGFGKAGVPMARAVERYCGSRLSKGTVIVKDGHGGYLEKTRVIEASHPEPDRRGVEATRMITRSLRADLKADDLVIVAISGGGSALFPLPVEEISLEDKQEATRVLIGCGATIQEINTIRKHLSQVKGGRLLEFLDGASVLSLVLSDVIGDDFASIASGPTAPDPTTFGDCLEIIEKYGIRQVLPDRIATYLDRGAEESKRPLQETPKPGDPRFTQVRNVLVANNLRALEAAANKARLLGFEPLILSSSIDGNTNDIARMHVAIANEVQSSGHPIAPPCCIISGGETTVRVQGSGKGGRNMEFALQCAHEIRHTRPGNVLFASIGSDGTDGPTDAAGAISSTETVREGEKQGLDIRSFLSNNDSYNFFCKTGGLIHTGPTQTNVMDLRFILIAK